MNTRKVFSYGNIVTILICLLPILSIYKFFVPGINLGDFLLMLVCIPRVLYCISHGEKLFKNFFLKHYFVGLCLVLLVSILVRGIALPYSSFADQITRMIRIFFYCFVLVLLFPVFNVKLGLNITKIVTIVSAFAVIVQTFLYHFQGISFYFVLKNYVYSSEIYNLHYYDTIMSTGFMRAGGFFLEPSHFCQYAVIGLCFLLFNIKTLIDLLKVIFVTFAIVLAGSGVGYVCLLFILFLYFISFLYERRNYLNWLFAFFLIVFAFGIIGAISKIDYFTFVINRFSLGQNESAIVWDSRMGSYYSLFESSNIFILGLGNGVGNTDGIHFYPSLAYILHCCGLLGLAAFILFGFLLLKHKITRHSTICIALTLVFFLMLSSTEIITNYWIIFYLVFVFQNDTRDFCYSGGFLAKNRFEKSIHFDTN